MTAAKPKPTAPTGRLTRRNHGTGHSYLLDGQKVPGVTTVLKSLSAPALIAWSGNTVADYAIDHWDRLTTLPPSARSKELRAAPRATMNKAAVRGTRIHALAEQLQAGEADVPDDLRGPVEAVARFLDRWDIEPLASELVVAHTGYQYAGTTDLFAEAPALGRFILDWKTGKGVYDEAALQLAAYRYCNVGTQGAGDLHVPETERAFVAHVGPDDVRLIPVDATQGTWKTFLHLLSVHRWSNSDAHPVGSPLWPETVGSL